MAVVSILYSDHMVWSWWSINVKSMVTWWITGGVLGLLSGFRVTAEGKFGWGDG